MATEARQVVVTEADSQAAAGQTAVDEGGRCGLCVVAERQGAGGEDVCGVTVGVATDVTGVVLPLPKSQARVPVLLR